MKPSFHHKPVNGYFEDPCLYVRILRERRAIQFDLGDIGRLSTSELFKISDVFVTHTHIDHFIGFDALLRTVLRRELPLNVYGPGTITDCVHGKLRGYSWNLITDYPAVINVIAFNGRSVTQTTFRAENRFRRETIGKMPSAGLLLQTPMFRVRAVKLDHDIPCLAYALEEELHINIDKDRLIRMGLQVGPWLSEYKTALRENRPSDSPITIDGVRLLMGDIADIAKLSVGQKITYATDISLKKKNISILTELAKRSDVFYCEAYFLEKDRQRALERSHITAKVCGSIAGRAGVKRLEVIHISPKYRECPELVIQEAHTAFLANKAEIKAE